MGTEQNKLEHFDPSGIGLDNGNLLGLPFDYDSAETIILGVPWEVTVSYRPGTAYGPKAVLEASRQLDIYDIDHPHGWEQGIYMCPISAEILEKNSQLRQEVTKIIEAMEQGVEIESDPDLVRSRHLVNEGGHALNQWLFSQTQAALNAGKRVGLVGGDHSIPLGYLQALATRYANFGILHIDAHADLRDAYEGFQFSHASIMFNALDIPQITKLVQVGIRDLCHEEVALIERSPDRIHTFYDPRLKEELYAGTPWLDICQRIVETLPEYVYISFDVDGLDPKLCPETGTPVPGGLELEQVFCLFREVVRSDRHIIGFDVSEIGNAAWDGNVGARAVYKLCNLMSLSRLV
ncbi:MAG: agmatinase family protein [Synechococcales cyanobacterium T60_A2020_003]|nr:agmatinase family protein [Synechococcales cyanobacterium T60_A2020_003]